MKHKIFWLLVIILVGQFLFRVYTYRTSYLTPFNASYWEDKYYKSQWFVFHSTHPIGDDGLYTYHAWKLIHGGDPSVINPEVPPLGKYLIGLSEVVFHNQNIYSLIMGILVLIFFFRLNLLLFKDRLLAIIPVVLFSIEPLFYEQLPAPFLDLPALLFLLLTLIFTLKRQYWWAALFMGCFAATKFSYQALLVVAAAGLYLWLRERKDLKPFLLSLLLVPTVVLLTYSVYFFHGHSPIDFLKLQKYILHFYAIGAKAAPGIVYPMLGAGQWHTWWDGVQHVSEWQLFWPLSFVLSLACLIKWKKVLTQPILVCGTWSVCYFAFLTVTPVWPRYLLLVLPFMYNLSVWVLSESIFQKSSRRSSSR